MWISCVIQWLVIKAYNTSFVLGYVKLIQGKKYDYKLGFVSALFKALSVKRCYIIRDIYATSMMCMNEGVPIKNCVC